MGGCSTYYSFCGNAAAVGSDAKSGGAVGGFRAAVCTKWLRPINMREHPAFSSWVIYGAACPHSLAPISECQSLLCLILLRQVP